MTSLNSSGALGNIISRLSGLKNVSGRRVMPGEEDLENLDNLETDVSGTAPPMPNFSNLMPPTENTPEADLGGQLTSQSYDVRANTVAPPSQEPPQEEGGAFYKLGQYLKSSLTPSLSPEFSRQFPNVKTNAQVPPVETAQVDMQEGLPPVTASEQEAAPQDMSFWSKLKAEATKPYHEGAIGNAVGGALDYLKEGYTPKIDEAVYERNPALTKPPALVEQEQQKQAVDQQDLDNAQMNPWQVAAYGATDAFANNPELVAGFQEYTGIDFDEQQKELTAKYEKVLSDIDKGLIENDASYDEQEKRIKERILRNEGTDADKYYIGLALLMPLLIGGLFGKEAALGALGGGAKGIADIFKGRMEGTRKDEEALSDIYKQRGVNAIKKGELEVEKMKIPAEVKKNLPKDEYEDLKGMDIYTFKDPTTGEVVAQGPEVMPDLYLDLKYGNTAKKREGATEKAYKLEEEKAALERANEATSDVVKAAMQLKDPGIMSKILAYALSEDSNGALKKIVRQQAPEIMVDGRKQNAAVYIDSKIEQIKDAYRRNEQMKAFTVTVANHIGNMAENPQYSGLKPRDLVDQMLILRDRGQKFFVDRASAQGFLRQPLENKFGKLNRGLYQGLNKKEEVNQLERDKQLMHASE